MVIGHVLPEKNECLLDAYENCRSHADAKACCDYALHVGVTWWGPKVQIFCLLSVHNSDFSVCVINSVSSLTNSHDFQKHY